MATIICQSRYSSDLFTVDNTLLTDPGTGIQARNKMLITEASNLGRVGDRIFSAIYDDACDIGLSIVSSTSRQVATFYLDHEVRDREDELQVSIFKPVSETLRQFPQLAGWTVHVLND